MKKLKVMQFICSTGFYGAERWVLALTKNLDRNKFTSELVITIEGDAEVPEVAEHFKQSHGRVHSIKMKNRFDLSTVSSLAKLMKDEQVDIIHTHGYKSDIIGLLAARKAGVKIVMTPHGFSTQIDLKLKTFMWLGCQSFRFADRVVPLSSQLMKDVRRYGVKEERLTYVQNGVDLSEIEEQRVKESNPLRQGAQSEEVRIGFVGQMIARKQIEHILDVFQIVAGTNKNIKLYLLGDGDKRAELEAYARTLNVAEQIEFLGFRDDRIEWLHSFDLFVMSSVLEGIPRCLMEAMAMGVPVAAYDIAGIDQLITHKETGYLATLNDKEELAKHWKTLINDKEESSRISDNALEFVNRNYSANRMAQEYSQVFSELAGK